MSTQKPTMLTTLDQSSTYSQVIEAHQRLNQQISAMNQKITSVIDKNEGQFLVAYNNHLRKIKMQLAEIKSKSDAQQMEMSKNDRLIMMEKQLTLFRQEALRLYDKLEEKSQEAEIYRLKAEELGKTCHITQREIKEHIKARKLLEMKLAAVQSKLKQAQMSLNARICHNCMHSYTQQSQTKTQYINQLNSQLDTQFNNQLNSQLKQVQTQKTTQSQTPNHTIPLGLRRKSLNHTANTSAVNRTEDSELKDWFLQCVKSIKRDVAQRKNSGQHINLGYVKSIEQFKMVDKLRLLEKFMENEKLITWMYEKIFPNRLGEIRDYFAKTMMEPVKKGSVQSEQVLPLLEELEEFPSQGKNLGILPATEMKRKKNEIRNRLSMRNGKLNFTMLDKF